MKDLHITIFIVANPLFAMFFYTIGRKIYERMYKIILPLFPKSIDYYVKNNKPIDYRRQQFIWIFSMLFTIFCSAILLGIISGELYIP